MEETIYDPVSQYPALAESCKKNAGDYFDDLVKKSETNVTENRKTVAEYKKKMAAIEKKKGGKAGLITLLVFTFIFAAAAVVALFVFLGLVINNEGPETWLSILLMVIFGLVAVGLLLLAFLVIIPKIKAANKIIAQLQAEADKLLAAAKAQMERLNALYDWNTQVSITKKTAPAIALDNNFDPKKQDIFLHRFQYEENNNADSSIYFVQSGTLGDNPFIIERDNLKEIIQQVYTGTLLITWTTTERDSEGHSYTQTHSETLTASLTRPAPVYYSDTYLFYGNDSAPKLHFSRKPTELNNPSEKEIDHYVKTHEKKIQKQAAKSLIKDQKAAFTALGGEDFDALFGATDRDNEVEFRVLFTPLAQKSMINVITKSPYGDDFSFIKSGVLNLIKSKHLNATNLYANPAQFADYDVDNAKNTFVNYQCNYFRDLYFAMAPLLSIPEYQLNKQTGFNYGEQATNLTDSEEEVLANSFPDGAFSHPDTDRGTILKSQFLHKAGPIDMTAISAASYGANHLVEYIPVHGGDGFTHQVPVNYIEYYPLKKTTKLALVNLGLSRYDYNSSFLESSAGQYLAKRANGGFPMCFQRGILAFVPSHDLSEAEGEEFANLLKSSVK